jgi:hypothetical protein
VSEKVSVSEKVGFRVRGRVTQGGYPPRVPTDPGVHVKCTRFVTLWNIAVPHTTGSVRGDTLVRHDVLGVVPTPRPQRGTPFTPLGPEGPFPRLNTTMGRCDSLPSISPRFVSSLRDTIVRPLFVPTRSGQNCGPTWSW